jgi:hypothetical protein
MNSIATRAKKSAINKNCQTVEESVPVENLLQGRSKVKKHSFMSLKKFRTIELKVFFMLVINLKVEK